MYETYNIAYGFKCLVSAISTLALAVLTQYSFDSPRVFAKYFARYFIFDSVYDFSLDFVFRPKRRSFELVIQVHHALGIYTMLTTPDTPVCLDAWRWITIGELTSPLLYYSLYIRTVHGVEPPALVSIAMLTLWPCVRFIAPLFAAHSVWQGECGTLQLGTCAAYIAMNAMFFTKLAKRFARIRSEESMKAR